MTIVKLIQLLQKLSRDHKKKVFSLKEFAAMGNESRASSAMALLRASRKSVVSRVNNLWINMMDPPELIEVALAFPVPSYLSFESALYKHGAISQSPRGELTMATTGRPRVVRTTLGTIRFTHLRSPLFFGFDDQRVAFCEKAWLDLVYTRGLRGRSHLLSEQFYPDHLNRRRLRHFARRFPQWVSDFSRRKG